MTTLYVRAECQPSGRLTADQHAYIEILNARHCLVPCIKCGANAGERCIGQYGRRTKSTHCARKEDAAAFGVVLGRLGDIDQVRSVARKIQQGATPAEVVALVRAWQAARATRATS